MLDVDLDELIDAPIARVPDRATCIHLDGLWPCSLDGETLEQPADVYFHAEDRFQVVWMNCTIWDSTGHRRGEEEYNGNQPYRHPVITLEGRMLTMNDEAAGVVTACGL